jgi:NTE family protein
MAWALPVIALYAEQPAVPAVPEVRPRIGLVLSGGGARGSAHVGVLKVLEELRIPIDAIAGTSMGAVVGGLYASGLTAAEIERITTSLDWEDAFSDSPPRTDLAWRRKLEDQDFLIDFPLGIKGRSFRVPRGIIQGQKLNQILRGLTLPVVRIRDFDQFPTRFRAMATDLETGESVVLASGDLTDAMRASLSAPGLFTPVERDGRILVDGGISNNLPVSVAQALGVDLLIVVDVSYPPQSRDKLQSVAAITNQMIAIMMRQNTAAQKRLMSARDIAIDPPLADYSSFDFSRVERAITIGEEAAREVAPRLAALSMTPEQFAAWTAQRGSVRADPPVIQLVEVTAESARYREPLEKSFESFVGEPVDAEALSERITNLYGRGNIETLDYHIEPRRTATGDEVYALELAARRNSWGPNYLRFGLNLEDDFEGDTSFNAAARVTLAEITRPGGEWIWDFQVGESPRIATEVYLPLGYGGGWFVAPHGAFNLRNVPIIENRRRVADYRVRSFDYGLDLGREFSNWGEFRFGVRRELSKARVRLGDPLLPEQRFDTREFFAQFRYDRLDSLDFPRRGQSFSLRWSGARTGLGSDETADLVLVDWLAAKSWGKHTAVFWTSGGTRLDSDLGQFQTDFPLGGFLNLSGVARDSLSGPHFAIARGLYYRQIGRGGDSILDLPVYVGASFEVGNVWDRRRDISYGSARKNGSIFFGLDTLIGPVYLGSGFDDDGESAFYLFLGRTF